MPHVGLPVRLIPPTAGIRLLALDGGGVRGIIPLVLLQNLEGSLHKWNIPLSETFDFVCGTSAGGLVIIGLFLMKWDAGTCIGKFEKLAERYDVIRAHKSEHDVSISDAASCTSAAPWYFKPKSIKHVGTFQDGGLQHNNPLSIALWELKHLWASKATPDFALSVGTGYTDSLFSKTTIGGQSPVKDRFIARVLNTFMKSLDGEKIWKEFYNSLPEDSRNRFHRINLMVKGTEPAIDDLAGMLTLKTQAQDYARASGSLQPALDSIVASSFYYEMEDMPVFANGLYHCVGHIFCRLPLPQEGRRRLYTELMSTSSYFIVLGHPVACIERITKNLPMFKRRVQFTLGSLDDNINITLRGIVPTPLTISGLPKTARQLIDLQGLYAPFGRMDYTRAERCLPQIPLKRKRSNMF
ncbi:hypothetical protein LTR08_004067 [Meristemomyces frigidus]|nr:hypothetical protein LTR08_004067 [Meristemomyces frigidus]